MDNTFSGVVASANSLLILLPEEPSFDEVAAGLSIFLSLKQNKQAVISCPSPMLVDFNHLIGVDKISKELGNKNLSIKFVGYPAANVERVSADVDGTELKLTVIPNPGQPSPNKDQVSITFSGVAVDLVILVGGHGEVDYPALQNPDLASAKMIHIGTRPLDLTSAKGIMTFVKPASSVSELIALIIKESGFAQDNEIATNLMAGIEEGSGQFQGQDVTPDTFELFAHLLRLGGQRIPQKGAIQGNFPPGSIPGQAIKVTNEQVTATAQNEEQTTEPAPKDWFEPKIYKGTSIN